MGISSSDMAGSTASDALHKAEDLVVMLEWAMKRIATLEMLAGVGPGQKPELPSERRSKINYEIMHAQHEAWLQSKRSIRKDVG